MVHYLDNAATTALAPVALEAMLPLLAGGFGNPSGAHKMARDANRVLDDAREQLADVLGVKPGEIVFTGGGTEADNLAIKGLTEQRGGLPVCSAIEHHAVLHPVEHLGGHVLPVTPAGVVNMGALEEVLANDISVVSIMAQNNESGVLQPIVKIAELLAEKAPNVPFHTDAVQAFCWTDIKSICAAADLISLSAHKFGGPKGVGLLVIKEPLKLQAQLLGGGQERERRAGTQNVAGIAGMAAAAGAISENRSHQIERVAALRDHMVKGILRRVDDVVESGVVNGSRSHKAANICHLCFEGVESEALLFLLEKQDIMASAASSCSSGAMEPSHVLAAMGYSYSLGLGSLRLSLGYETTAADVDAVLEALPAAVERIREYA